MSAQFRKDLFTLVTSDSGVSDLIGTRFYPGIAPQNATVPYAVNRVVSTMDGLHHQGAENLKRSRIQIDCVAASGLAAEALADAIIAVLHGRRGTTGSTKFFWSRLDGETDDFEPSNDEHRKAIDFLIQYQATA